ncbi:hypothetical protein [Nocardiopsis sp. CNR-923]|uniref:hypothetical protein n=1 Tax=Nocardiopsis sp. CNR-923 TaxID=1904965 RepID=UPI00373FC7DD
MLSDGAVVGLVSPLMLFHLCDGGVVTASEHNRGVVLHDDTIDHERMSSQFKRALGSALSAEQSREKMEGMI